jgi:hypothetical protein
LNLPRFDCHCQSLLTASSHSDVLALLGRVCTVWVCWQNSEFCLFG